MIYPIWLKLAWTLLKNDIYILFVQAETLAINLTYFVLSTS